MSDTDISPGKSGGPIVAVGASAGGLEACRALFRGISGDAPASFVLILHLDPAHDSMMVDLLAPETGLTVVEAHDGMALRPGHLHVIPPGFFLSVSGNRLRLSVPEAGKGVRLPFDVVLGAIARDAGADAICIVLSGTGSDGTAGLARIHEAGGLVIAQDPSEAGYPGMPESAIASGLVDQILQVGQMPAALARHWKSRASAHPPRADEADVGADAQTPPEDVARQDYSVILDHAGKHAPHDLSLYKLGTLERRIARRMALAGLAPAETEQYLAILRSDPVETEQLVADLLIHSTGFFRDGAVFRHLSERALPDLLKDASHDRPLRVWVAGCSTGEEAYSLAMVCLEAIAAAGSPVRLQVLASDVDPHAVATARTGFYPPGIESQVSAERLARFFVRENGGWRVTSKLRDTIVFTVADLLSDPPFSRIDLVSCRNVLIYLAPEAQRRVIAACCFALRPGGLLLLGSAETPGPLDGRFAVADKTARLWQRTGSGKPGDLHLAATPRGSPLTPRTPPQAGRAALAELCRKVVLEDYAPAVVLMTRQFECLYMLGPTERYLRVTQGHADPGFLGLLPKEMRARFRDAAAGCDLKNPRVSVAGGRIPGEGAFRIDLRAVPDGHAVLLLACFVALPAETDRPPAKRTTAKVGTSDLKAELERTRGELRTALRDLEREVEARGADVADVLSVNEEFQSTNEELLASKEELQSLNEELTALNSQLQETLERHRNTANDLQNVLYSTDVATLFLDRELNVRFYTPAARALFRVIPTDIGRPLSDLAAMAKDEELLSDARAVLATSDPREVEIATPEGVWYLRRIQPYRVEGGETDGVVITFNEITERKRTSATLEAAVKAADAATHAKSRLLAVVGHDLRQPLQALALLHGLMTQSAGKAEQARFAALLERTLHATIEILDSLLDINLIESGVVKPKPVPMAIGPLIAGVVEEFAPLCEQKGLKLRTVPCKAWVRTDPKLLRQILRNLLSNALKYANRGGILVGCRRKGTGLQIEVHDTGIGVAKGDQGAIFDPYWQIDQKVASGGRGLGLSIVRRLADLLDHPVTVRSTLGKGSAFMVRLPMVSAELSAPPGTPLARSAASDPHGNILLVEEDDQLRGLLTEVLESAGHTVIAQHNARAALDWASADPAHPDLLIADLDLDDGSGGVALSVELANAIGAQVPSLILTGHVPLPTMTATTQSHLIKPVSPEVLLASIAGLLSVAPRTLAPESGVAPSAVGMTVHIVDDDPLLREAASRLFEAEGWIVATYVSAEEFLSAPRPVGPACLIVDAVLPGMDGVSMIKVLREEALLPPAIILTGYGDAMMAVSAMKAGASDLIEKPAIAADLLVSVRSAVARASDSRARDQARREAKARFAGLTDRQREVLTKVLQGAPNKIIAADLGINQRTVENHRAAVMRKTGSVSLPALVRLALAAGINV